MIDPRTITLAALLTLGLAACNEEGAGDVEGTGADAVEVPLDTPTETAPTVDQ